MTDLRDIPDAAAAIRRRAMVAGLGVAAAGLAVPATARAASGTADLDGAVLNFALQLAYLQAEFHQRTVYGVGLPDDLVSGQGTLGAVAGGRKIAFSSPVVSAAAAEIANDDKNLVTVLRGVLGARAVARPAIDIGAAFQAAGMAAGIIGPGGSFDPYANDLSFLFASFNFVDLGVTALIGAASAITSRQVLARASALLATRAYHAGTVRSLIFAQQIPLADAITAQFAALQAKLSSAADAQGVGADQSTLDGGFASPANVTPTDPNGLAFARSPRQVLNVLTGARGASRGLFFPAGLNGGAGLAALLAL